MITQHLNGAWEFRRLPGGDWQPAQVPGSVHLDLMRLGQIPDPFFGDNEKKVLWVGETDWQYRRRFDLDQDLQRQERVFLAAGGLDTLSEVSLNGHLLGSTDNMFRGYRWDVTGLVRERENELVVTFASPVKHVRSRYLLKPLISGAESIPGGTYLRKAACSFGWDWGPKLATIGIWREIRLEGVRIARLADVHLRQHHQDGQVAVSASVEVERWGVGNLSVLLEVIAPDGRRWTNVVQVEEKLAAPQVIVAEPELWWPNGYGSQPLYTVSASLLAGGACVDRRDFSLGLRTLELRREPDEWGESFTFIVNGAPIFAKGSNWIPPDAIPNRASGASTEFLLKSAAETHQNMLRIWGGGYYEDDHFYDLCDRLGLLVWQDFMFACGIYPLREPGFLESLQEETVQAVRRLRHHACLALWCGNNEMETGWAEWGWTRPENRGEKAAYRNYFYRELPEILSREDPDHPYWASSPSSGSPFQKPNSQERGDAHYWDVWHGRKPFSAYLEQHPRFMSEFGFQSFPPLRTTQAFADPGDWNISSYIMDFHQRSAVGNELILSQMASHFRIPRNFEALVYLSMVLQAEGIRRGVEHWRREKQRVSGALYWQLNDTWPGISWSSIDYYGRWKALHYAARRFFAPLLLTALPAESRIELYLTSDYREEVQAEVSWSLETLDGDVLETGNLETAIPPLESRQITRLDFDGALEHQSPREVIFAAELRAGGEEAGTLIATFVPNKHLDLRDPRLEMSVRQVDGQLEIRVTAHSAARFIELDFRGTDAVFSDNYFDLPANRSRTIHVSIPQGISAAEAQAQLQMRSLFDSY